MLILPRNIQALACCAGACLQSFLHLGIFQPALLGNFQSAKWGFLNRRKLGNIRPALTLCTSGHLHSLPMWHNSASR